MALTFLIIFDFLLLNPTTIYFYLQFCFSELLNYFINISLSVLNTSCNDLPSGEYQDDCCFEVIFR